MKNKSFLRNAKGLFYWQGWHPEVAVRYLPVVKEIKKIGNSPSVLDVGSGGLGIAPYLGRNVTGIDVKFRPPFHRNLEKIRASAESIPFADNVYDAVVAVDAFEHMTEKQRRKAIKEMLRVAKKLVVIAVPSGQLAYLQDKKLSKYYRKKFGKRYHFFEEQLRLGLPEEKDLVESINKSAQSLKAKIKLKILNNESLRLREFLMKGWMTKNIISNIFFRKILLLALPVFTKMNKPPVYRKIFVISKQ